MNGKQRCLRRIEAAERHWKKKCCRLNDNVSSNQDIVATTPPRRRRQACRLHVDEVESAEGLRQAGDDGSVALGVVVQLEQWGRHQLVVTGHRKIGFLLKVNVGWKKLHILNEIIPNFYNREKLSWYQLLLALKCHLHVTNQNNLLSSPAAGRETVFYAPWALWCVVGCMGTVQAQSSVSTSFLWCPPPPTQTHRSQLVPASRSSGVSVPPSR